MPEYNYKCGECSIAFKKEHGMREVVEECPSCGSVHSLKKMPSNFLLASKKKEEKIGDIVKRSIKEFREELNEEKQLLKEEIYD
jgi:putative FmdB family regulatory protein